MTIDKSITIQLVSDSGQPERLVVTREINGVPVVPPPIKNYDDLPNNIKTAWNTVKDYAATL